MGILFTGLFWGVVLVLLGLSVILKAYFHIDLPVFRTVFGLLLILLGVQVLLGRGLRGRDEGGAVFSEQTLAQPVAGGRYSVAFGKGVLDLSGWSAPGSDVDLRLDTVFGHSRIRLNPAVPTEVDVSAAFSGAQFPDGTVIAFGRYLYRNKAWAEGKPCLRLKASVVFGGLEVLP